MIFGKKKNIEEYFGTIVPIVKCIRYNSNIKNVDSLKNNLIKMMIAELMGYTEFNIEDKGDGTVLLTARLDVVNRNDFVKIPNDKEEEK